MMGNFHARHRLGLMTAAWAKGGAPLPYKRRLAYLEGNGSQWIDTGVYGSGDLELTCKFHVVSAANPISNPVSAFGSRTAYGSRQYCIMCPVNSVNTSYMSFGNSTKTVNIIVSESRVGINLVCKFFKSDVGFRSELLSEDGTLLGYVDNDNEIFTTPYPISIFGMRDRASGIFPNNGILRVLELSMDDGVNSRNFIPVMSLDDVPCMYDEVSGQLFYNQGTGELTPGPEVT